MVCVQIYVSEAGGGGGGGGEETATMSMNWLLPIAAIAGSIALAWYIKSKD